MELVKNEYFLNGIIEGGGLWYELSYIQIKFEYTIVWIEISYFEFY